MILQGKKADRREELEKIDKVQTRNTIKHKTSFVYFLVKSSIEISLITLKEKELLNEV